MDNRNTIKIMSKCYFVFSVCIRFVFVPSVIVSANICLADQARLEKNKQLGRNNNKSVIKNIVIKGNVRVLDETIKSCIPFVPGDSYDTQEASEAVKVIGRLGLFQSIDMNMQDDGNLVVTVAENEYIKGVEVDTGGGIFSQQSQDDDSEESIVVKENIGNSLSKPHAGLINNKFIRKNILEGDLLGTVSSHTYEAKDGFKRFVLQKIPGERISISRISFVGNKMVPSSLLEKQIATSVYTFGITSGIPVYHPMAVMRDSVFLRNYYMENGYLDVVVYKPIADISIDNNDAHIYFQIDEGKQYRIQSINIDTNIQALKKQIESFKKKKTNLVNSVYRESEIKKLKNDLTAIAHSSRYHFIDIEIKRKKDSSSCFIDLDVFLKENKRSQYINKIIIKGNTKTRTNLIMSIMDVQEGDCCGENTKELIEERLYSSGLFESVSVDIIEDQYYDVTRAKTVIVNVKENEQSYYNFTFGFSSGKSLILGLPVSIRNIVGTGYDLDVNLNLNISKKNDDSIKSQHDSVEFVVGGVVSKSNVFGSGITTYCGISYDHNNNPWPMFRARVVSCDIGIGFDINKYISNKITFDIGYRFFSKRLYDIDDNKSSIKKSKIKQVIDDNIRQSDNKFQSNVKYAFDFNYSFNKYFSINFDASIKYNIHPYYYWKMYMSAGCVVRLPLNSRIRLTGSMGQIFEDSNVDMCILDSFPSSGIRGLDSYGFGPGIILNKKSRYYVGAKSYYKLSIDWELPIKFGNNSFIKAINPAIVAGCDMGIFCRMPNGVKKSELVDEDKKFKMSVSIGLKLTVPVVQIPLILYWHIPCVKEKYNEFIKFSVGGLG